MAKVVEPETLEEREARLQHQRERNRERMEAETSHRRRGKSSLDFTLVDNLYSTYVRI